jgi:hypothetical protein
MIDSSNELWGFSLDTASGCHDAICTSRETKDKIQSAPQENPKIRYCPLLMIDDVAHLFSCLCILILLTQTKWEGLFPRPTYNIHQMISEIIIDSLLVAGLNNKWGQRPITEQNRGAGKEVCNITDHQKGAVDNLSNRRSGFRYFFRLTV